MLCPLCGAPCRPMPVHPQAQLFRCRGCTHAFTLPESIRVPESYEASYYDQDHSRWFEHPNIELFERILAGISPGASVVDVGCGRGDFLRFAHAKRPDLCLTGIDLSANADEQGIRFLQGDILKLQIAEHFVGGLITLVAIFGERMVNDGHHSAGQGIGVLHWSYRLFHDGDKNVALS